MSNPFEGGAIPFDDSEEVSFDTTPAPEGDYALVLEQVKVGVSTKGNPKISWGFKIVDDEENKGKFVWHDTVTTGKGVGMFKAVVSAMGYDFTEWMSAIGALSEEALLGLVGERVEAKVTVDTPSAETLEKYPNAKDRNKISRFLS